ncbi:unnamed protein product [Mytilus coruscus]|uniref:Uncharacterized protein n=1 Tax=Mytilus coruscus TaxID=42192 RepID=A0A6J8EXU6_MYTCO|nr:unnamed protein product [Mytilus coruscus]
MVLPLWSGTWKQRSAGTGRPFTPLPFIRLPSIRPYSVNYKQQSTGTTTQQIQPPIPTPYSDAVKITTQFTQPSTHTKPLVFDNVTDFSISSRYMSLSARCRVPVHTVSCLHLVFRTLVFQFTLCRISTSCLMHACVPVHSRVVSPPRVSHALVFQFTLVASSPPVPVCSCLHLRLVSHLHLVFLMHALVFQFTPCCLYDSWVASPPRVSHALVFQFTLVSHLHLLFRTPRVASPTRVASPPRGHVATPPISPVKWRDFFTADRYTPHIYRASDLF